MRLSWQFWLGAVLGLLAGAGRILPLGQFEYFAKGIGIVALVVFVGLYIYDSFSTINRKKKEAQVKGEHPDLEALVQELRDMASVPEPDLHREKEIMQILFRNASTLLEMGIPPEELKKILNAIWKKDAERQKKAK